MPRHSADITTIGLMGLGDFGRLAARALSPHFKVFAYDPAPSTAEPSAALADARIVGGCDLIVLATPIDQMQAAIETIAPHLRPGALVLDVGSVKTAPADIMRRALPPHVDIIGTHPLFGPQSAADGLSGLKIALCPLRGTRARRVGAFLRAKLGLKVYFTTPEAHDLEAATVQGLTHFIAKALVQMEPLPSQFTTKSYDVLRWAVDMVRHDAPSVFDAIERGNPYAADVRKRFLGVAAALDSELAAPPVRVVAFQGEPGAFGELAIKRRWPGAAALPMRTFDDVLQALIEHTCDLAVLPVWNTTIGDIAEALAALERSGGKVEAFDAVVTPVRHALLAPPGATLSSIKWVGSHAAALGQCARFFAGNAHLTAVEAFDTAGAARELGGTAAGGAKTWFADLPARPEQLAVIANAIAAAPNHLTVLVDAIQDDPENATRFAVLRRKDSP